MFADWKAILDGKICQTGSTGIDPLLEAGTSVKAHPQGEPTFAVGREGPDDQFNRADGDKADDDIW